MVPVTAQQNSVGLMGIHCANATEAVHMRQHHVVDLNVLYGLQSGIGKDKRLFRKARPIEQPVDLRHL